MNKQFESHGNITENPFDVKIVKDTGEFEDYYLIKGDARDKITFADLINEQADFVKIRDRELDSELCNSENYTQIGNSEDSAKIGSSGDYARIGSSGYYTQVESSGYSAKIGSSGDYTRIGNSGDSAQIGNSGDSAQIGSNGDCDRIGSSGYSAQIGSSGYYTQIGSSGDYTQIGSSGNYAQIASSGNSVRIGSSGNYAQIASSGNSVQIGSNGDSLQIGSSGYYAQIVSNGDSAQIGSSGDSARIRSSGNYAQIASSGYYAQIDVIGNSGVAFACGMDAVIKAKYRTWISLCEYEVKDRRYIPVFALAAQIGNNDYVDYKGEVLSEDNYYILKDKKFTPVIMDGGLILVKISSKFINGIEVIKCRGMNDLDEIYCVRKGELSAHGRTLHQAMSDLVYKEMQNRDVSEIVEKIKKCGYVTREDYRCITGACSFGTEQFAKEHGYADKEKAELNELLLKLDGKYYGAKKFKELFQ